LLDTNRNRRGFTDHEHLNEQKLIHMNGRVYDYNMGRFMSVDPLIQSPTSTQSINPYSYIMNNPLAGTDPTGYCGSRIKDHVAAGCTSIGAQDLPKASKKGGGAAVSGTIQSNGGSNYTATFQLDKNTTLEVDFKVNEIGGQGEIAQRSGEEEEEVSTSGGGDPSKPIENDGWEYKGKTEGVDTYQTTHNPSLTSDGNALGDVNDNIITPTGLAAGYIQNKTEKTKRRWSSKYKNHGKIWDKARLVGNYAFVVGGVITAGTTVSDIVDMRNSGSSTEDMVLRGVDGVVDIAAGALAFAGPIGWGVAAAYYGADYLSGGNLTKFIYHQVVGRRENEPKSEAGGD
jgi:RHS repeat-associated protein